jgi:hypothetical protein
MNFTRVNPGGWTNDISTITQDQLNGLDIDHAKSINGDDGGTWTPTDPIAIEGAGLYVTVAEFDGTLSQTSLSTWTLEGTTVIESLLNVASGGKIDCLSGGLVEISIGANLDVLGIATIKTTGTLDIEGNQTVASTGAITVESGGVITVEGGADITVETGAEVTIQSGADIKLQGQIIRNGDDAGDLLRIGTLADADADAGATKDVWFVEQDLSGARTYTLDKTTRVPTAGETMTIRRGNGSTSAGLLKLEDATLVATLPGSGDGSWAEFIYWSGEWHLLRWGGGTVAAIPAGTY